MRFLDRSDLDAADWGLLAALAAAAAVLRLVGLGYGLPALFNGDEPHYVNVAVSFGRGSLDPGVFKYPTLWMYVLFAAFAAYFLAWSGLGLRRSVADFGQHFVWEGGRFYLIGRLLSAALSLAALERLWAAGRALGERRLGLWAAALLAVSLPLVEVAHFARPDSLMLLLSATSWTAALAYHAQGRPGQLLASAAAAGLAVSTQYTAAPAAAAPLLAWALRRWAGPAAERPSWALGAAAAALVPAAFLAGSPYVLVNNAAFRRDLADHVALNFARETVPLKLLGNIVAFGGPWWLCGPLLAAGAIEAWRRDRRAAILLLAPVAAHAAVMLPSDKAHVFRYLTASLPPLALVAAYGVEGAARAVRLPLERPGVRAAVLAALLLPGGIPAARWAHSLTLPDTRLAAGAWIRENLPPGTRVLMGAEVDNPPLRMSKAQAERLLERTRAAGHARARYYQLMVESHPGGGYEVLEFEREPGEMDTGPWHRRWSQSARDVLDVSGGVAAARAAGVEVAILSSMGLGMGEPTIARFLRETEAQGRLLAEFKPEPGRVNGPLLRVYRIGGAS